MQQDETIQRFPRIDTAGTDGLVVRFADRLSEPANRAALAFRAALDRDAPAGVEETSTALVSVYLRVDPFADAAAIEARLHALLGDRDWTAAALPAGRALLRIPALFEGAGAPDLAAAAAEAGLDPAAAVASLTDRALRVIAIGFAPGQPYLGTLPEHWDLPRRRELQQVPAGALVQAVRQLVLFSQGSPTGWRHVGQTAVRLFQPGAERPFLLAPGDEVRFEAVDSETFVRLEGDPSGGLRRETIA
ncbi:5-oxoprolinase subunit B family protein [Roseivivax sp. CAU 1761]